MRLLQNGAGDRKALFLVVVEAPVPSFLLVEKRLEMFEPDGGEGVCDRARS